VLIIKKRTGNEDRPHKEHKMTTQQKQNRREFLKVLGTSGTLALCPGAVKAVERTGKPPLNYVFILIDDLGWSDLGCYGADLHETPNIDEFARRSMTFTNAYAAAPVCTPTRASIMTGKCPARLNMTIWREASKRPPQDRPLVPPITVGDLPHDQLTIAEAMHDAGYQTTHIGKWHLGGAEYYPETQGFDVNIGGTLWGAPNTYFYPYRGDENYREYRYVPHLEFGEEGEYLTDRLTDEALDVMKKVKDQPFFLHLAYHTVHTPMDGKPDLVEYYRGKIKPDMHHQNPYFAAMVHSMDENVGRILDGIRQLGIEERTVVVFFSDNGGFINEHRGQRVTNNYPLRSGKGSLYEGGIREPMIVNWPGVTKPGSVCHEPVSSVDFYPTFLEMAGLSGDPEHNATLDGMSLVPLFKNPDATLPRQALFWHYPHYYPTTSPVSAVRQRDWKLLEYFEDGHLELYNLKEDLGEKNNLAEKMPERASDLHRLLKAWRDEVDAQLPKKNTR